MEQFIALRYKDLACRVPTEDVKQSLKKISGLPATERLDQIEQTKEFLERRYKAMLSRLLNKKQAALFGLGVAILYANEIYEGRAPKL